MVCLPASVCITGGRKKMVINIIRFIRKSFRSYQDTQRYPISIEGKRIMGHVRLKAYYSHFQGINAVTTHYFLI